MVNMMGKVQAKSIGFVLGGSPLERLKLAVEKAVDYDDMAELAKEVRGGNPHLVEEPFRTFVADRLEGKPVRGRGEKRKNKQAERKKVDILIEVARHVASGVTKYSNSGDTKRLPLIEGATKEKTACELAAEKFSISESSVQKIWKERRRIWSIPQASGGSGVIGKAEIRLRCEIFVLTGRPAKSSGISDLIGEAQKALFIFVASRQLMLMTNPDHIDGLVGKKMEEIFPHD